MMKKLTKDLRKNEKNIYLANVQGNHLGPPADLVAKVTDRLLLIERLLLKNELVSNCLDERFIFHATPS